MSRTVDDLVPVVQALKDAAQNGHFNRMDTHPYRQFPNGPLRYKMRPNGGPYRDEVVAVLQPGFAQVLHLLMNEIPLILFVLDKAYKGDPKEAFPDALPGVLEVDPDE